MSFRIRLRRREDSPATEASSGRPRAGRSSRAPALLPYDRSRDHPEDGHFGSGLEEHGAAAGRVGRTARGDTFALRHHDGDRRLHREWCRQPQLLCASVAPVPRLGRGHRLRSQDRREGERARAAAPGAPAAFLERRHDRVLGRHRLLPADRSHLRADAPLPRGLRRVPQPRRRHDEGRARAARRRRALPAGARSRRRGLRERALRRRRRGPGHRAQREPRVPALRNDRASLRRRHLARESRSRR